MGYTNQIDWLFEVPWKHYARDHENVHGQQEHCKGNQDAACEIM